MEPAPNRRSQCRSAGRASISTNSARNRVRSRAMSASRNRIRRLLREIVRAHRAEILPGWQMVIIARWRAPQATLEELEQGAARLAEELEYVRQQQQAQEKDALALDHEQRKLAEESARSGQRLSYARLEMERLQRAEAQSRERREQSQAAVAEREVLVAGELGQDPLDHHLALEAAQAAQHGIAPIDLVVVNLYPFEQTVAGKADFDTCVENIDIGGPAMIRAAAKNHEDVAILTDPAQYAEVIAALAEGGTTLAARRALAGAAYARTAAYGHFGRAPEADGGFSWEKTDLAAEIKRAF